jgi:hypothetical protein
MYMVRYDFMGPTQLKQEQVQKEKHISQLQLPEQILFRLLFRQLLRGWKPGGIVGQ